MKERNVNSLIGIRKIATAAAFSVAFAAGCGSTATETAKPTLQPTETPAPTLVVTPTPEVTPLPTSVVTPEPTLPSNTITREGFFTDLNAYLNNHSHALDRYKQPIAVTDLNDSFTKFMASPTLVSPYVAAIPVILFAQCTNAEIGKLEPSNRETSCALLTNYAISTAEKTTKPLAIDFAQKLARYDLTVVFIDKSQIQSLASTVKP